MSDYDYNSNARSGAVSAEFDAGLRAYMLKVYNYMAGGVGLTGIIAYFIGQWALENPQAAMEFYSSGTFMIVMFSPLAFILVLSFGINRMNSSTAQLVFWAFAAVMGVSLSSIFLRYTGVSITRVFFITTIMFGSLSLWGYTTKRSLSGMGTFLFMGLIGLIVAMIVNMFLQSAAMEFAISLIGVGIFAGLTAWDTQKIKQMYFQVAGNGELAKKTAIMGAVRLYLDFVNMFLFLLRLFGGGRN